MRPHVRISILALVAGVIVAASAPAAAQAAFGVESFFAGNCNETHKECNKHPGEEKAKAEEEGFTQAAGHPNWGVTDFTVSTIEILNGEAKKVKIPFNGVELAKLKHVRIDVAPGVSTNPQAVPKCSAHDFGVELGGSVFEAPTCPASTKIGIQKVVVVGPKAGATDQTLEGKVYNLEQTHGLSSLFGVALEFPKAFAEEIFEGTALEGASKAIPLFAHTLIEGGIEYASDYHDFFEISVSETLPLISSRLTFEGNLGGPALSRNTRAYFLTNGTSCTGNGPQTTTRLAVEDGKGETGVNSYETPIGGSGCNLIQFAPTFSLEPETKTSDKPNGITIKSSLAHPEPIDSSDLRTATIKMPEGMTINPSAASGLEACTAAQLGIHTRNNTACPPGSRVGTVALEVPGLPAESLKGFVYLGQPENGKGEPEAITGPPYTVYLDAESSKYNIKVRLKGTVEPNAVTGQLTTTFAENPEQPFSEAILHFNGGAFAPIANPLACGTGAATSSFTPFSGFNTPAPGETSFTTEGCSSPAFAPTQSLSVVPGTGAATSNLTFTLTRPEGQQYLHTVTTTLPAGVAGKIPTVPLCPEAQANATQESGKGCSSASLIGTARVTVGSGTPYPFNGTVYLTGPYNGAPYGLAIKVPSVAGPFNLGEEVTRATINVDPHTARVIVASTLPTIKSGVPLRLRSLTVEVNRPNYIVNPTNCGVLATESTVTSTLGTTALVSSPFQAEGCEALAFSPTFKATTSGKPSKANGASLETTLNQVTGNANVKLVKVQLPKQLPSRLTTLQKACLAATFEANPYSCPAGAFVGGARANTPLLPGKMTGPAILVSHAGAAFPDLDLLLEANGVRVILVGNTDIKKGITTTTFATTPDAPVSSITVNLPLASNSALAANGNLCVPKLVMPTTIIAQNGKQFKQNTTISPIGCGVQIVGQKAIGNTAYLTVKTFAAGRISGSGSNYTTVARRLNGAENAASLKVPLSPQAQRKHKPVSAQVRVGFYPKKKGAPTSTAYTTVVFR